MWLDPRSQVHVTAQLITRKCSSAKKCVSKYKERGWTLKTKIVEENAADCEEKKQLDKERRMLRHEVMETTCVATLEYSKRRDS